MTFNLHISFGRTDEIDDVETCHLRTREIFPFVHVYFWSSRNVSWFCSCQFCPFLVSSFLSILFILMKIFLSVILFHYIFYMNVICIHKGFYCLHVYFIFCCMTEFFLLSYLVLLSIFCIF